MSATPLWFGPEECRLFGWLHVPEGGMARGAVVLCPALGLEGVCAQRTMRVLADQLAARRLAALRMDYGGTADSAGAQDDPDRVPAWKASIAAAVAFARSVVAGPVGVVAMRVGATLVGATGGLGLDALVLWDPCASGRGYLREQQALTFFALGERSPDDGSAEAPGIVFSPATVQLLGALRIAQAPGPLARRVLVLTRPRRPANRAMTERLQAEGAEFDDALGQEELVDVEPFAATVPTATVERISAWLADVLAGEPAPVSTPKVASAVVGHTDDGRRVVERVVRLGPLGLFGIVSEIEGADGGGTAAVMLNSGVLGHTGPARLWVELGRRWAAGGLRTVRCDLSGLGESPTRPGQPVDLVYPPQAFEDMADIVSAVAPGDPRRVVLVGLCSGGYHAVEGAIALGVGGICAINPILTAKPSEITADDSEGGTAKVDARRRATTARKRWARALPAHDLIGAAVDRLPDGAWWLLNRVAVEQSAARALERVVDNGVETYIICGEREAGLLRRGEGPTMRRLSRSGRFELEVVPGIDHELFSSEARARVLPVLTDHVLARYAHVGSVAPSVPGR